MMTAELNNRTQELGKQHESLMAKLHGLKLGDPEIKEVREQLEKIRSEQARISAGYTTK